MVEWRYDQIPFYVSTHDNSLNDDLSREYIRSEIELQKVVNSYTVDKGTLPYHRINIASRFNFLLMEGFHGPYCFSALLPGSKVGSAAFEQQRGEPLGTIPHSVPWSSPARVGAVELGGGTGQLLVGAALAGAIPVAILYTSSSPGGEAAALQLGPEPRYMAARDGLEHLTAEDVDLVLVSAARPAWGDANAAEERTLLLDLLPVVVARLEPTIVVVVREVGMQCVQASEVDEVLGGCGFTRAASLYGLGASMGEDCELLENLDVKGGFPQVRRVLHYERSRSVESRGPLEDFQADLRNPKLLRNILEPLERVPAHAWLPGGHYEPRRRRGATGGPDVLGHLTFGRPGDAVTVGCTLKFPRGGGHLWVVARDKGDRWLLHRESGGATATINKNTEVDLQLRRVPVCSQHGPALGLKVSGVEPWGPANMALFDDRTGPGGLRFRFLLESELARLVGITTPSRDGAASSRGPHREATKLVGAGVAGGDGQGSGNAGGGEGAVGTSPLGKAQLRRTSFGRVRVDPFTRSCTGRGRGVPHGRIVGPAPGGPRGGAAER